MVRWLRFSVALLAALAVVGTVAPAAGAARVPRLKHVWVFVMENHSYDQIIGSPHAPYVSRLARRHGTATRMWAVTHPSLPNYLAMIAGGTRGCNNNSCERGIPGKTLTSQMARHGLSWRGYFEGLPERGYTGDDVGDYVQHHNPFVYFRAITSKPKQRNHILSFHAFRRSLRHPPALSFIVPSDAHNMHSSAIIDGDNWLRRWVPHILASRGYRHHGAIFITWDEADKTDLSGCCLAGIKGGHQPFVAIVHGGPKHVRIKKPRTAYSLLRTIEDGFRLRHLGHAAQVKPLSKFF
ncbi:MAG TPA: alkaline phosphatase family protein [Gaiellales bacterium]|nr:alkaline phosphatase family protein [Gaiellales bacterium]